MKQELTGILLAAGCSSRFGSNKLHQVIESDTPMAVLAARNLVSVLPYSIAVVREEDHMLPPLLEEAGLRVVINPDAKQGMGTSIAAGVKASDDSAGWMIALADMPFIPGAIIQHLIDELLRLKTIVAPTYQGQRGHPVGFDRVFSSELMELREDQGARSIIARHFDKLVTVEVSDHSVITDIDLREELNRYRL